MQVTEIVQSREKMLAMNEALMLGSLRQHELTEAAELLNIQLQRETFGAGSFAAPTQRDMGYFMQRAYCAK